MRVGILSVLVRIWAGEVFAQWDRFEPSSGVFLLTFPGQYLCCESYVLCVSCVFCAFASVRCCLVVACWGRAGLVALVCDV